jgi:hypothetical protein
MRYMKSIYTTICLVTVTVILIVAIATVLESNTRYICMYYN